MLTTTKAKYDIEDKWHNTRPSSHMGRLGGMAAFSEIGKSASRSVSSSKFYLRTTVAWPLCLRHNILRNEPEIFHNNANVREKWRLRDTGPSRIYLFILSLHFVPSMQSAVCILYLVFILCPVCSLQSAVYSLHFVLTETETHWNMNPWCSSARV